MALKGDYVILESDITRTCETAAEAGQFLVAVAPAGSGSNLGESAGSAEVAASASGKLVLGLIPHGVVSYDRTRYHGNFHKNETYVGERCEIVTKGWFVTDKVTGTPTDRATAYLTANGVVTPTLSATGGLVATPKVGVFDGIKDENGYVKVILNLPVV